MSGLRHAAGEIDHGPKMGVQSRPRPSDIRSMAERASARGDGSLHQRRRHARVAVAGKVRLVADSSQGLVILAGTVIDLSISDCAIRVQSRLEPQCEARLELEVDGKRVWLPGHIVRTRTRDKAWIVGIRFDHLVPEKQSHVTRVVARRRLQAS
jgi:c-di-GMP-binding flagellar brake protein YcgR